jgi:2-polyprenyl-3-methyl-5-hydroxy-6-metoxy-1,4-benzoquinol methylase
MINYLHSRLFRLERGWDPVPEAHAVKFAAASFAAPDALVLSELKHLAGTLENKRVLDLGAGPGLYSTALAELGAAVTWHDPSGRYAAIARQRAMERGLQIKFSLGYLEDARRLGISSYDIVLCRACWNYCRSDRRFARLICDLLRPGGLGYVKLNTSEFSPARGWRKLQYYTDSTIRFKVGHPDPPPRRVARIFCGLGVSEIRADFSHVGWETVSFFK